jgi:hypothetical protein
MTCNLTIAQSVVMNEIFSRGTPGDYDWIELYNTSGSAVDISGYQIYDNGGFNGTKPKKQLPSGTVIPGYSFYVVSTEDGTSDPSNFGLSASGEKVWFENSSGQLVDTITFAAMTEIQSYGRLPDGSPNWQLLNYRTKGEPNSNEQPISVIMNEIFSRGTIANPDWIEIYNKLTTSSDLSGFKIYDNGGSTGSKPKKELPAGSIIQGNGFLVISTEGSGDSSDFGLSSSGEMVWLENSSGRVVDSINFPALAETQSYARIPDGGPNWQISETITKGLSNSINQIIPTTFTTIGQLPSILYESSGLAITAQNKIWSHNDAGNENKLYCVNTTGELLRTITITNVTNTDWEDLAVDNLKRIYIADVGNNNNDRQNLAIYRIPDPESFSTNQVSAEIINYTFEDQNAFPPPPEFANFDVEAVVWFNDSLFLFTKDRTSPLSGFTKLYKIPASPGTYVAKLIGSYYMGYTIATVQVTAADINHETGHLVLLAKNRLVLFKNYSGSNFFSGEIIDYTFTTTPGQAEAIAFTSPTTLIMTEEGSSSNPGKIYEIVLTPQGINNQESTPQEFRLEQNYPNPFNPSTTISFSINEREHVNLSIYNILGKLVDVLVDEELGAGRHSVSWDINNSLNLKSKSGNFNSGIYFYQLKTNSFVETRKLVLMK